MALTVREIVDVLEALTRAVREIVDVLEALTRAEA